MKNPGQAVRAITVRGLRWYGYRVLVAANGREATEAWAQHSGAIDLLFTDIRMPGGISGLELVERFRRDRPGLKVVVSSGYSEEMTKLAASIGAGVVFLAKPYDVKTLARAVRECLDAPA